MIGDISISSTLKFSLVNLINFYFHCDPVFFMLNLNRKFILFEVRC